VGGFGSVAADAPRAQTWPSGVEITESLQPARGLRLRFGKAQGSQAARSGRSVEKEDPARVQANGHYGRGLAYISAHSGNDASGDGRTPTHDPRLLAAQQPPRHEQVPAGDVEDQASGTRQVGRRLLACRLRDVVNTVPAPGGLNGSSSLENFTKRIDFRTNFLAAVTLSTSMKYVKVENNHRGAFRICARTPPKG